MSWFGAGVESLFWQEQKCGRQKRDLLCREGDGVLPESNNIWKCVSAVPRERC